MAQLREIALIWAVPGIDPRPSTTIGRTREFSTLKEACDAAAVYPDSDGKWPWLRAGTGYGSAVLDVQGIELLRAAFDEGAGK